MQQPQTLSKMASTPAGRSPLEQAFLDSPRGALGELIECYGARIEGLCRRLVGPHPDSQDLAQDVFVVAIERGASYRGDSSLETWLYGIAIRICRKWIRRQAVKRRWLRLVQPRQPLSDTATVLEARDLVQRGLEAMRTNDREVLVLRYIEDQSVDEISMMLDVGRGAIEQRLSRARQKLAKWIQENEAADE